MSWHSTEGARIQKIINSSVAQMAREATIQLLSDKFEAGWEHFIEAIVTSDNVVVNSSFEDGSIRFTWPVPVE